MYHGYQDALINGTVQRLDLGEVLGIIDHAQTLGADYSKVRPLKKARQSLETIESLHAAVTAHIEPADQAMHDLGAPFLNGKVSAADVLERASRAAAIAGETGMEVRRLVEATRRAASQAALADLRTITEDQWIDPLRPLVHTIIEGINSQADALGIHEPAATVANIRTSTHPWSPSRTDLERTPIRHAWENMADLLDNLDDVHSVTTGLRQVGLIPVVEGRDWCEDYRRLHLDHLQGDPTRTREFWLSNRAHGEPGIYTSTELSAARGKTSLLTGQIPRMEWA